LSYFDVCAEKAADKLLDFVLKAKRKGIPRHITDELDAYRVLAWMQRNNQLDCIVNYEVAVKSYHLFLDKLRRIYGGRK